MLLPSSKVVVLITVIAAGSPPAGEDDGVGGFCFFCGEYDVLCFFCRHQRRWRLPYSLSLQSVQGRTPACGNRSFPLRCGGCGGHPPHIRAYTRNRFFAYQPQVARRREPPPIPSAYSAALAAILMSARMTRLGCFFSSATTLSAAYCAYHP